MSIKCRLYGFYYGKISKITLIVKKGRTIIMDPWIDTYTTVNPVVLLFLYLLGDGIVDEEKLIRNVNKVRRCK